MDLVHDLGAVPVGSADDCLHAGSVEAVDEVMLAELVCGRDGYGADLVKRNHGGPELVVTLEDQHDLVPLADAH